MSLDCFDGIDSVLCVVDDFDKWILFMFEYMLVCIVFVGDWVVVFVVCGDMKMVVVMFEMILFNVEILIDVLVVVGDVYLYLGELVKVNVVYVCVLKQVIVLLIDCVMCGFQYGVCMQLIELCEGLFWLYVDQVCVLEVKQVFDDMEKLLLFVKQVINVGFGESDYLCYYWLCV